MERSHVFHLLDFVKRFDFGNIKFVSEVRWILWLYLFPVHVRSWIYVYLPSRLSPLLLLIALHHVNITFVAESF